MSEAATGAPWITLAYLVTGVCFILGLKWLSSPTRARQGNQIAAVGMLIAVLATVFSGAILTYRDIAIGVVVGAVLGAVGARRVKMTAMPQMVAIFNGAGGGAAALISMMDFLRANQTGVAPTPDVAVTVALSTIIGSISFSGSIIAFAKLQELLTGRPVSFPGMRIFSGLVLLFVAAMAVALVGFGFGDAALYAMVAGALALGLLMVLPIGGADMPVVISLLNSFTGLAAAFTGFVLGNDVLIISGALVGASGTLLTQLMSKAMNRSLLNVLFAGVGAGGGEVPGAAAGGTVRPTTVEDVATMLAYAGQVIVVPGYGMAVAQAQHNVRELADALEKRGVSVKYAIHPVAGRMPGHMNVLLAEANVPYTQLFEMEQINPEFSRTDVVLVIGANDVINPAARTVRESPIYGMPILDVDKAKSVVVLKRSMKSGFAGVDNPIFYEPTTYMLFGDAKDSVVKLVAAVAKV
ncbi:MAG TPA: NAD(P)(+) transhydrogenase (Re/Si-specific) subunit beta [Candidatus Dormibacteraeota bacterium]|nr:NAD(P)(+) transhydrogenase (Re/Si-specific) subunit beta [Candidatus Dormibacteraeota bacterium]